MAYDVTGLTDFIKGDPQAILTDIILSGRSFELLRVVDGIKGTLRVPDITDNEIVLQTGDYTGYNSFDGDDTFDEVDITVVETFVKKKFSRRDLQAKVTQLALNKGSDPADFGDYQAILMSLNGQQMALANEKLIWQGDTGSGTPNLALFNGIIKIVTDSADEVVTGTAATAFTSANALTLVELMVDTMKTNFPEFIDIETHMYGSPADFQTYYRTLYGLNAAIDRDNIEGVPVEKLRVPGTNIIFHSMAGFDGTNELILTRPMNFIIGTDLVSEDDDLTLDYNKIAKWFELFALYKLGAQVARTSEVVRMAAA